MSRNCVSALCCLWAAFPCFASQDPKAVEPPTALVQTPDFAEGNRPNSQKSMAPAVVGPIAPAEASVVGTLSGRVIYTSGGHGWTYNNDPDSSLNGGWITQRGVNNEICEDFGNLDQMTRRSSNQ
jgi:hypothetical protein